MILLLASLALASPLPDATLQGDDTGGAPGGGEYPGAGPELPAPIQDGQEATLDQYPSAVAIMAEANVIYWSKKGIPTRWLHCSGTRIAPDVVITAGHCLHETIWSLANNGYEVEDVELWLVSAVDVNPYEYYSTEEVWLPERTPHSTAWVHHPGYDGTVQEGRTNDDIGLVFLDTADEWAPMSTLVSAGEVELEIGMELEQVGWGKTSNEDPAGVKQWGTFHVTWLYDNEFAAGDTDQGDSLGCSGDSGGPVFARLGDDSLRLVGVDSYQVALNTYCGEVGFTTVEDYLDWVDQAMRDACADGTRVWCEVEGILPTDWEPSDSEGDTGVESPGGCGCASGGGGAALGWLLPALALRRRRTRSGAPR